MLTNAACLAEEECLEISSRVYELKKIWHTRANFYTLGAASYLDAASQDNGNLSYYGKAKLFNPILREQFAWLYDRLSHTLAKELGQPVCYRSTLALPGFHIFPVPKNSYRGGGGMHLDLQYKSLNWEPSAEIDFDNPISFTLPIALPEFGGGLNISDLRPSDLNGLSFEERTQVLDKSKKHYPYKLGYMTIHRGLFYHGIAAKQNNSGETDRITLQGHGLLCQDTWHLYW